MCLGAYVFITIHCFPLFKYDDPKNLQTHKEIN